MPPGKSLSVRALTTRAMRRFKWMASVFCTLSICVLVGANAETYIYGEKEFELKEYSEMDKGYITEYTNKEELCTSFVTWKGLSLMNEYV